MFLRNDLPLIFCTACSTRFATHLPCCFNYTPLVASPSAELVRRVRELYQRNSSDVRFLIPVLHGLQKVHRMEKIRSEHTLK